MLTKRERWEYHRMLEQASERQLRQELHDLEYAAGTLPADSEERRDVLWMNAVAKEEVSARAEVAEYRRRRLG